MSTILLMHFDGANGSQSFIDSGPSANVFTPSAGTPTITTGQQKFGTGSISFVGASGNYASCPAMPGQAFGIGDFTIEWWQKVNMNSGTPGIFGGLQNIGTTGFGFGYDGSGRPSFMYGGGYVPAGGYPVIIDDGNWHAVAIVRSGGSGSPNLSIYFDGVIYASINLNPNITGSSAFQLGGAFSGGFGGWLATGYMDELRISSSALYLGPYTPATHAFGTVNLGSIVSFNTDPTGLLLPYRWKSKQFFLPWPTGYQFCRITAESYVNTVLNLFADGVQYGGNIAVTGQTEFAIPLPPNGTCLKYFEFALAGTDKINRVQFAEDIGEFQ